MVSRIIAAALAALMPETAAAAHVFLEHASPPVGGRVAASPSMLDLLFTEGVVPHFSHVEVLESSGQAIRTGPLRTKDGGRDLIVPLPTLSPGQYTVV
jgi:copper resistance protein C